MHKYKLLEQSISLYMNIMFQEMPPKKNSQPNNGSAGDPSVSDMMNLLRQQSVQLAQQQQQFQQQQQ